MALTWTPNHVHSHYSLLDGLNKPEQIAERCHQLGYSACTLTDHGNVSGAIAFMKAMKKKNIKAILGCEFYISMQDAKIQDKSNPNFHQVILAKNKDGWKDLINLTSRANGQDVFYTKPRIDREILKQFANGNLISTSGHPGSILEYILLKEGETAAIRYVEEMQDIFGKENFLLEIQTIDSPNWPYLELLAEKLRSISQRTGAKCMAAADCHFSERKDAIDHRVLLCSSINTTLKKINHAMVNRENVPLEGFFRSDSFHIPSVDELLKFGNTEEEIQTAVDMAEMCENYDIKSKPRLPKFLWTGGLSELDYLKQLCNTGWERVKHKFDQSRIQDYKDELDKELKVIVEAGLQGYFLIVQDYVNYGKSKGWLIGPGRGSAGGCLVSFLLNITSIDPLPYGLIFERFYNAGRNTADHISYPDIDVDFPIHKRGEIVKYIQNKYGNNRVGQICTFGRLQGKGALKEVLRIHDACSFNQMNEISKCLPDESEISDELEESKEDSIIRWTLQNEPKNLADYCTMNDDGELVGEFATYFAQAIRLEGTYKTQGKHAAGLVIADDELANICPLIRDKDNEEKICGFDMKDIEYVGLVKMDILGVAALDKLMMVNQLLRYGK